jgi:hydroxymethylpyrimidine/phosphomethylpyrimidine kinase
VLGAIAAGTGLQTGHGHGPLNHGFAPVPMHRLPLAAPQACA